VLVRKQQRLHRLWGAGRRGRSRSRGKLPPRLSHYLRSPSAQACQAGLLAQAWPEERSACVRGPQLRSRVRGLRRRERGQKGGRPSRRTSNDRQCRVAQTPGCLLFPVPGRVVRRSQRGPAAWPATRRGQRRRLPANSASSPAQGAKRATGARGPERALLPFLPRPLPLLAARSAGPPNGGGRRARPAAPRRSGATRPRSRLVWHRQPLLLGRIRGAPLNRLS